ncbi:hypothetical protein C5S39_08945, partial [Candidatus Methanophagaceae archaeon]
RYRYTGMERDEETGLNYHSARYYAPWLGRWVSFDPEQGTYPEWSSYCYANTNPLNNKDATGRITEASALNQTSTIEGMQTTITESGQQLSRLREALRNVNREIRAVFLSPEDLEPLVQERNRLQGAIRGTQDEIRRLTTSAIFQIQEAQDLLNNPRGVQPRPGHSNPATRQQIQSLGDAVESLGREIQTNHNLSFLGRGLRNQVQAARRSFTGALAAYGARHFGEGSQRYRSENNPGRREGQAPPQTQRPGSESQQSLNRRPTSSAATQVLEETAQTSRTLGRRFLRGLGRSIPIVGIFLAIPSIVEASQREEHGRATLLTIGLVVDPVDWGMTAYDLYRYLEAREREMQTWEGRERQEYEHYSLYP